MNCAHFSVLVSVMAVLSGLILVMLFCHMYITPLEENNELKKTLCNVTHVDFIHPRTPLPRKYTSNNIHQSVSRAFVLKDEVKKTLTINSGMLVTHRKSAYFKHKTSINNKTKGTRTVNKISRNNIPGNKPCVRVNVAYQNNLHHTFTGPLFLNFDGLRKGESNMCFCHECDMDILPAQPDSQGLVIKVSDHLIKTGLLIPCLYLDGEGPVTIQKTLHSSQGPIIHGLLWPSILFITGFVGLFFSCLATQRSSEKQEEDENEQDLAVQFIKYCHTSDSDRNIEAERKLNNVL